MTNTDQHIPEKGQAGAQFREVPLPEGMTPELAAKIERMICQYVDAANGVDDHAPIALPLEFGIAIFREISGRLRS